MTERSEQLQSILVAYIEAAETGQAPNRDELLARHPEFAAELAEFLDGRERIQRVAPPLAAQTPPPTDMPTVPLGTVRSFGDYELLEEIARGGMGVVYRARQVSLNRTVALKMILSGQLAGAEDVRRFTMEAEAAANLDHPNIVPIYEVGECDGQHYFSMKLVEGSSLAAALGEIKSDVSNLKSPQAAAQLLATVARAVHHAHQRGILHRDLKPGNILVDVQGEPHVTDFGLARKIETDSELTPSGAIVGTPNYMAPEQAAGKKGLTVAVDIYALGAILYALLTGRPPFPGDNLMETLRQVVEQEPAPPRSLNPGVPRDLETICLKCLEKDPARRYATAQDLTDDLGRFREGEPIRARRVGRLERGWKWCRRHPWQAGLGVASTLLVLLLVGGSVALFFYSQVRGLNVQLQVALENSEGLREEAQKQREEAEKQRDDAHQHRQDAEQRKAEADQAGQELKKKNEEIEKQNEEIEKQKELVRRNLFGAQMKFADLAWQENRMADLGRLLERYQPVAGYDPNKTLRRFEWDSLWRLYQGDLPTLKGHKAFLEGVCWSPDGNRVASADRHGMVKVWNARTGEEVLSLKGRSEIGIGVCFSPDGTQLASGGFGAVTVWDTSTGEEVRTLGRDARFTGVCFSPDGKRLAAVSGHPTLLEVGEVKVWKVRNGREELSLKGHNGLIHSVCWSPDGTRLATAGVGTATVWDAWTGEEVLSLKGGSGSATGVCWSPDGALIAAEAAENHTVAVWDAHTGEQVLSLKGHSSSVKSVCFSPDGTRIASASDDEFRLNDQPGELKVWDLRTGQEARSLKGHTCVCWSPDGTRLASASDNESVKVWDACIGQEALALNGHDGPVQGVCFSPDGTRLASAGNDKTVKLWDARTGEEVRILGGHTGKVYSVCFSADGKRLASAGTDAKGKSGEVKVWDLLTGREELSLKGLKGPVMSVCLSPDGKRIATGSEDGGVKVWDAGTGQEELPLKGLTNGVACVAFSPDGTRLACASFGAVMVWDARTGEKQFFLKGLTGLANCVCWSSDGKRLATSGIPGTVQVWDAVTGQQVLTLEGHIGQVHRVCFSPDATRLASAGGEMRSIKVGINPKTGEQAVGEPGDGRHGEVKVWDAATGQELRSLKAPPGAVVVCVCFAPDGNRLASGDSAGTVSIWEGKRDPKDIEPRWRVWQRRQASACEENGEWFAAAFHLRQVLKAAPDDATLKARLAYVLGNLYAEQGEWAEAVTEFQKARQLQPQKLGVRYRLVIALFARANASARAADAASRTLGALSAPFNYSPLSAAAPFSRQDDLSDYRRACAELLRDFGQTKNAADADDVAWLCVVGPQAVKDPALPVQLAQKAVNSDPDNAAYRETLGAALYRAGDFDAAVRELNLAVEKDRRRVSVEAKLFLAMSHHRLKHPKAANDWYARAVEQVRQVSERRPWHARLLWQLLGEEAEALLQPAPQP